MKTKITPIQNGDRIFATGVFLIRNKRVLGGWIVDGFEDDSYKDGLHVEFAQTDDGETIFYTESPAS